MPLVLKREEIIGSSPIMEACMERIAQAAASDANVLISGETGTGKELFAQANYINSPRSDKNFVTVDCAPCRRRSSIAFSLVMKRAPLPGQTGHRRG